MIERFMRPEVLTAVQGLRPIADELGVTLAQLALAWVLSNDNVAAAIVGASRPEQVAENVKAVDVQVPPELLTRIDEVLGGVVVRDPAMTTATAPASRPA
jgi:aryl-alcohol dehydrogenase-like predicted oxidoreductase